MPQPATAGRDLLDAGFIGEERAAFGGEVQEDDDPGTSRDTDLFGEALPEGRVLEVVALSPAGLEAFVPLHHPAVWMVEHIEEQVPHRFLDPFLFLIFRRNPIARPIPRYRRCYRPGIA